MSSPAQAQSSPAAPSRRLTHARLLILLPVAALVAFALSFFGTMDHTAERTAANNAVKLQQPVVQIGPGSRLCQGILVPRDAATVQLFASPTGPTGPPLALTLTDANGLIAKGRMAGGWTGGIARFPIKRVTDTAPSAEICVRNNGKEPIAFGGLPAEGPTGLTVDGTPQKATMTVQFFRGGTSSWWSLLPTIAHRAGVLKGSLSGAWVFWFAVALFVLAAGLSVGLMFRGAWR